MYDAFGVVEANIKPVIYSEWKKHKGKIYAWLDKAIKDGGATKIDYADNMCTDGVCQVLDPYGNPIYSDILHFRPFFTSNYLDCLDVVVE